MNILRYIYNGKTSYFGEKRSESPEYNEVIKRVSDAEEKLLQTYPEIYELFEEYRVLVGEFESVIEYEKFELGFRSGVQFMLEMMKPLE